MTLPHMHIADVKQAQNTDRYEDRVIGAPAQMREARYCKHRVADFAPLLRKHIRTAPPSTRSGACIRVSGAAHADAMSDLSDWSDNTHSSKVRQTHPLGEAAAMRGAAKNHLLDEAIWMYAAFCQGSQRRSALFVLD